MLNYCEAKNRFYNTHKLFLTPEDIAYIFGVDAIKADLIIKSETVKPIHIRSNIRVRDEHIFDFIKSEESYNSLMNITSNIDRPIAIDNPTVTGYDNLSIFNAKFLKPKIDKYLRKSNEANRGNFVYFITDGTFVKIGVSNNIKYRLGQLQTGNPRPLQVMFAFITKDRDTSKALEEYLHALYSDYNSTGEWFKINEYLNIQGFKDIFSDINLMTFDNN